MRKKCATPLSESRKWKVFRVVWAVSGILMLGVSGAVCSGWEQSFLLKPGWNAVFLEVTPDDRSLESAFAGVPVASVWTWMPAENSGQFIQDPNEEPDQNRGWLGYFPRPRPEAFLTNLFILQANRAYLVKLEGTQNVTWRVRGKPSLRKMQWVADSFNFVGFHVDPDRPPTFGSYFSGRSAFEDQPIYRLGAGDRWTLVEHPFSETINPGEAYWVYCKGPTDFDGPLEVSVEWGDRLDFGSSMVSDVLVVRNRTEIDVDIMLRRESSRSPIPLSMRVVDEDTGKKTWAVLPTTYVVPASAGMELLLDMGIRRKEINADEVSGVLEVLNGLGARRLVEVTARAFHAVRPGSSKAVTTVDPMAGLWQGTILVNGVSEAQRGGTSPKDTGRSFPLRVLIHVDSSGKACLLKEVIEMWQEGTTVADPANPGYEKTETPGRAVLVTDEDLIPDFEGVTMRDGVPVGIRLSTIDFDFPGQTLEMSGTFSADGEVDATVVMASDFPTNPFLHRYHPDHDNLDNQFLNPVQEAYEITRHIRFVFSPDNPELQNEPEWGDSLLAGDYFEEISGLHRNTIYVGGTFRLRRVAGVPELNR